MRSIFFYLLQQERGLTATGKAPFPLLCKSIHVFNQCYYLKNVVKN